LLYAHWFAGAHCEKCLTNVLVLIHSFDRTRPRTVPSRVRLLLDGSLGNGDQYVAGEVRPCAAASIQRPRRDVEGGSQLVLCATRQAIACHEYRLSN
jgi:hypothetical protein